jgi:DNA polymerase-3 subunit alpha
MKALSGVNAEVINQIIAGRPYVSFTDFMNRCPLSKTAMIPLIKSGAFDKLEEEWAKELNVEPRILIMVYYISKVCEPKKKLTLQNFNGLIQRNLIPEEIDFQKRVYIFNKYLKDNKKVGKYYVFDDACIRFYSQFFDMDNLDVINGYTCILQTDWDKIYKKEMDVAREWLKAHHDETLEAFNALLFKDTWDKYAEGSISAWEMQSLCFYYHEHELANVNTRKYGIVNFNDLSREPVVDMFFKKNGKQIPLYKLSIIVGTVISKNDTKSSVTILTTDGVVTVKFTKEYYAMYNRQLSEKQPDGTKKIIEKGWFTRGTKIMVTGFRRDDAFVAKRYSKTATHQLYKIIDVKDNGEIEIIHERSNQRQEEE